MRILEATAGGRSYWFDKENHETVFCDMRIEDPGFLEENMDSNENPGYSVRPQIQADYRRLPFPSNTFDHVVFDPPHLVTNHGMAKLTGVMKRKYGCLKAETWPDDLRRAFIELFRVMKDTATISFKFSDHHIGFDRVLEPIPPDPLYGTTVRAGDKETRWLTFNKPVEMRKA
jgi:hypothetical protein